MQLKPVAHRERGLEQLQWIFYKAKVLAAFHHALSRMGKDGEQVVCPASTNGRDLETIWQEPMKVSGKARRTATHLPIPR